MTGYSKHEIEARGHPVWAEIDLAAIRHNIGLLDSLANGAEVMGVVKGYAYGHGNPASARAMLEGGATRIGVARVAEGIHLRESGIDVPIHVFTEPPPGAVRTLVDYRLTPSVYTLPFAEALSAAVESPIGVHLKIDTGMHRVGIDADDALDAARAIAELPGLEVEGAWSHLATADVVDHPFTRKQLDLFIELTGAIERAGIELSVKHIANSAATISMPDSHLDVVRCGVASYGLSPFADGSFPVDLRPALTLKARVNMVKTVAAGEGLSYGLTYEMPRTSRVITVPAGYADGYDRRLSGRADVLVRGKRFRVSGTVCMDQFLVDVGDADVEVGDVVTLIGADGGNSLTAEELAAYLGTVNYEVTARVPSRVPRLYLNELDG